MTDKELHRNEAIVAGIVILALLLWWWFHNLRAAQSQPAQSPSYYSSGGPTFNVPGGNYSYGPVVFPQAIYNISGPQDSIYNPSSCNCGCSGGNAGPITYEFPDMTSLFSGLYAQLQSADLALIHGLTAGLPYAEQVFVTNNTPTPFG